ncbi:MAG: TolC family protein [Prevotellaceae bacterium]|nr:TolC family protein [Prevotellaceae bacterium]
MKINYTISILLLMAGCATCTLRAQEQIYSLADLYTLADGNNKSIRVYSAAKTSADEALASSKAGRLPDISSQLAFSYNGRGIITDRDFSNLMNIYIPEFGANFALKVSQVIYSGGAVKSGIQLGKMGQQMAELDMQRNAQEVRYLITGEYLDIYKALNTLQVLEKNIDLARQVLQDMQNRYGQGTVLKNDITRYELLLETLRLQYIKVEDGYKILNHRLCADVGLPDGVLVRPDTTTLDTQVETLDELYWQQQSAENNYTLKQTALATEMSQKQVSMARAASLPHLNLFAEDYLLGPVTIDIPAINKNFNYWYVGLGIQYNISSLFRNKHDIRKAKQDVRKAQEEHELAKERVNVGVQAAYTNFQTAFSELETQRKSVQLATENYGVIENRYQNGLALITDMLDASNMKLSAELKLVDARIDLIYDYYTLKYLAHSL